MRFLSSKVLFVAALGGATLVTASVSFLTVVSTNAATDRLRGAYYETDVMPSDRVEVPYAFEMTGEMYECVFRQKQDPLDCTLFGELPPADPKFWSCLRVAGKVHCAMRFADL